jgi:hypothetical protein
MTPGIGIEPDRAEPVAPQRQLDPDLAEQPQHLEDLARLDGIEDVGDLLVGHGAVKHGLRFVAGGEMR